MTSNRLLFVRNAMANLALDALLVTSRESVYYLSGFSGSSGDLLITHDAAYIFCDFRYTAQAAQQAPFYLRKDINGSIYKNLNEVLFIHHVSRLGVEDRELSHAAYKGMQHSFKDISVIGIGDMLSSLRTVKDYTELENMRTAARIADEAFAETVKLMKPGMTEIEVAAELEYHMRKRGSSGTSFETIVASGVNSAKPHGTASSKVLEHRDLVVMDFGCIYNGYCSDMTRTVAVGEASAEQRAVYNSVLFTQLKVLSAIGPGMLCADMDKLARNVLDTLGYAQYFGHSLGHGVGINVHEQPTLSPKSTGKLVSGTVVTVEPGIYLDGNFGVRIEDTVIITDNSIENLTNSTKELVII